MLHLYAVVIPYNGITGVARVCDPEECPAPAYTESFDTFQCFSFLHFVFCFVYLYFKQLGQKYLILCLCGKKLPQELKFHSDY